ncbi:hypothetical protein [Microbacterium azadirachtae]|uniref:hypothetical protein n=1 Tax=Microbacterium azadirachtae TaxID=582680 RepID=UPI003F74D890
MRAVAAVAVTLWVREIARVLGTTTRRVTAAAAVSCVLLILFGLGLALVAGAQLGDGIAVELRLSLARTSFSAAAMTAGIVAVILCLSAPPRTALQNLLDLLPVSRAAARLGQLAPVLVAGLVYSAALTSTAVVVVLRTSPGGADALRGIASYVVLLASFLLGAVAAFTALQAAAIVLLRLPVPYASTFSGVVVLAGVLALTAPDILALRPSRSDDGGSAELLPARAFARLAAAPDPASAAAAVLWAVIAVVLLWRVSRHHVPGAPRAAIRLLRRTRPIRRTAWWGQLWAELLIAVRTPQFVVTALLLPLGVLAVWVLARTVPASALVVPTLAGSLPVLPFVLAVNAVGRTLRTHWLSRLAGGDRVPVLGPKALAAGCAGVALGAPVLVAVLLAGLIPATQIPDIAVRCALGLAAGLLCGAIVPYSEEQPLSASAAGFLLAFVYMSITLASGWVAGVAAPGTDRVLILAAITVLAALYAGIAARQTRREPTRA